MFTLTASRSVGYLPCGRRLWPLVLALPLTFACESATLRPGQPSADELFWELRLDHHAVMMSMAAPYDTLTITATPRNAAGETLAGTYTPQFTSTDILKVRVSQDGGLIEAVESTPQPVWVRVTLTVGNVTRADSVLVYIVDDDPPPTLATFSIQPVLPDSARLGQGAEDLLGQSQPQISMLPVRALDDGGDGTPFAELPVHFTSSNPDLAEIDPVTGEITPKLVGSLNFHATSTVFGTVRADTLPFEITWPVWAMVSVQLQADKHGNEALVFDPSEVSIGVGGAVYFHGINVPPYDLTFADPANVASPRDSPHWIPFSFSNPSQRPSRIWVTCDSYLLVGGRQETDCSAAGGNAMLAPPVTSAIRIFPVAGTYEFESTMHGISGRVVVVGE